MATQLSSWIRGQFELNYSMMKIMRAPSVRDLAGDLLKELEQGKAGDAGEENSGA